jgi:hypothetical protein
MSGDNRKYGALSSSVDPEKLSLTVKGLIPLIVFLLPLLGFVNVGENDIMQIVEVAGAVVAGAVTLYGLLRKLWANKLA